MVMRRAAAVAACLALLVGCGADEAEEASDEEQVAGVANGLFESLETGDGEAACGAMTERGGEVLVRVVRRDLPGGDAVGDCEEAVVALSGAENAAGETEIVAGDVSIEGDTAEVSSDGGGILSLERVDDEWLVSVPFFVN